MTISYSVIRYNGGEDSTDVTGGIGVLHDARPSLIM